MSNKYTCDSGDVVTFLQSGSVRMTFGKGIAAEERQVSRGDIIQCARPTQLDGVVAYISTPQPPRTIAKHIYRGQTPRMSGYSIARMEMPSTGDKHVEELERRLAERGAAMRDRIARESAKLANG